MAVGGTVRGGGWDRRPPPSRGAGFPVTTEKVGGLRPTPFGVLLGVLAIGALLVPGAADPGLWSVAAVVAGGLLLIGVIGSAMPRRFDISVTGPATATVGEDVPYRVTVTGIQAPVSVRLLDPTGSWVVAVPDTPVEVSRTADRRGVLAGARIEVWVSGAPGVAIRRRTRVVPLSPTLVVGPRPLRLRRLALPSPTAGATTERPSSASAPGDVVRSVRPYAPGDPAHLVHWPSTARRGEIVVRDLEPPVARRVAVVVDLRDLRADAEPVCSLAAGLARHALADGSEVLLATCADGRPTVTVVRTAADIGRALARAHPGPPGGVPPGWPVLDARALWWSGLRDDITDGDVALIDAQRFDGWGGAGWPIHAPVVLA